MTTTVPPTRVAIDLLAEDVIAQLLAPRRARLNRRAPRSQGGHQLRRSIQCGKARPVQMLLQLAADDLADQISLAEVEAPFRELVQAVRTIAATLAPPATPELMGLMRQEAAAEAAIRQAELDTARDPNAPQLLDRLSTAVARGESAAMRLGAAILTRRLALLVPRAA